MADDQIKINTGTITRTILLAVAIINQILTMMGKQIIPWSDNQVYVVVSSLYTICTATLAWWKNNSFSDAAKKADIGMKKLKTNSKLNKLNTKGFVIVNSSDDDASATTAGNGGTCQ